MTHCENMQCLHDFLLEAVEFQHLYYKSVILILQPLRNDSPLSGFQVPRIQAITKSVG